MRPGIALLASSALAIACGAAAAEQADTGELTPISVAEFATALAAQRDNIVIVNLWATWCVPCLKEIPDLVRLEAELADRGVTLVPVSMDDPADFAFVDAFRRQHFPGFSSYLRATPDMDTLVSVVDFAWNEVLPTTYIIDRQGNVARRIQGKQAYEDFYAAVAALL